MRRFIFWSGSVLALVFWALVLGACGKKAPEGPFVPLVARLPSQAALIAIGDFGKMARLWEQKSAEVLQLPVIADNPGLKQLVEEQQGLLRSMVRMATSKFGLDLFEDIERVAVGVVLRPEGDPAVVVVATGKFPTGLFQRVDPEVTPEKLHGADVLDLPGGLRLGLVGGKELILAETGLMEFALKAKPEVDAMLIANHPKLLGPTEGEFLGRLSFHLPPWLKAEVGRAKGQPGVSTLLGTKWLLVDVARQLKVTIEANDKRSADNARYLLEAQGEMIAGGQRLVRGMGLWLMALDLDALPNLPARVLEAAGNRKALLATLDRVFPPSVATPVVALDGKRVTLTVDKQILGGVGLLMGVMAAVAVPSFMEYQARAAAAGN